MDLEAILQEFTHSERAIFQNLIEVAARDCKIFCYVCVPKQDFLEQRQFGKWGKLVVGGGAGYDRSSAMKAAVGECLERYSAVYTALCNTKKSCMKLCHWKDLDSSTIPPETYILFSNAQYESENYRYSPFTKDSLVNWITVDNETLGQKTFAPAALVYLPYRREASETHLTPSISTGLSLGNSREEAILKGLYEVVERDALALAWHWCLPVKKIVNGSFIESLRQKVELDRTCEIHVFYLTQDISIPTVIVFLCHKESDNFRLTVGCATRYCIREAIRKAFLEALQGIPYIRGLSRQFHKWKEVKSFDEVRSFQRSAVFYTKFPRFIAEHIETGNFLNISQHVDLEELENTLPQLAHGTSKLQSSIQILADNGYQLLSCDLTLDDLRAQGVYVFRALIPGLQGVEGSYRYRYLDDRRASKAAATMGVSFAKNPLPHPLP